MVTEAEWYGSSEYTSQGAATLTLHRGSARVQVLDVSATPSIVKLPDATKLREGTYRIVIHSLTGGDTVTVQDSAAGAVTTVAAAATTSFHLSDNSTAAGTWHAEVQT